MGVANLTDEEPPRVTARSTANEVDVLGKAAFYSQYDWLGRRVFANLTMNFDRVTATRQTKQNTSASADVFVSASLATTFADPSIVLIIPREFVNRSVRKMPKKDKSTLKPDISRRDFVNGTLVGVGAALLGAPLPGYAARQAPPGIFNDPWTGYGGVGDYAVSNGNVAAVREAAHLIRDGLTQAMMPEVEDTGEEYDMVIIGGGFSGIGAAYQFHKKHGTTKKCLIIENHPVFGGEAKQNEFEVDGYKLCGPQGSNDFGPPDRNDNSLIADIYRDTGLPFEYAFVKHDPEKTKVRAPLEHFYGVYWDEERYDTGYFLGNDAETPWVVNPRKDNLARLPWSDRLKAELNRAFADKEEYYTGEDLDRWLDSMSYKELLEEVMGYTPK